MTKKTTLGAKRPPPACLGSSFKRVGDVADCSKAVILSSARKLAKNLKSIENNWILVVIAKFRFMIWRRKIKMFHLTLSLLGYLKTRICWGEVNLTPPSKSHVWCPNMTNDTLLESFCALLLESAKKFAKIEFFIAKSSYIVKMFGKKNLSKK